MKVKTSQVKVVVRGFLAMGLHTQDQLERKGYMGFFFSEAKPTQRQRQIRTLRDQQTESGFALKEETVLKIERVRKKMKVVE